MLLRLWSIAGAVGCGLLVASLAAGGLTAGIRTILLSLLLVCLVVTLWVRIARTRNEQRPFAVPVAPDEPEELPTDVYDQVLELLNSFRDRDLEWLRVQAFDGPWRDVHVASVRLVARFDAAVDRQLMSMTSELVESARDFLRIYDSSTTIDPVTRDGSWRVIGVEEEYGSTQPTEIDHSRVRAALIAAAADVCRAYDRLEEVPKAAAQQNNRRGSRARAQRAR